jgi:integrase
MLQICQIVKLIIRHFLTRPLAYAFLSSLADEKGPNRANVYRKNLLAAWNWGIDYVDGFPQGVSVLEKIKPFPVKRGERYVPPEEDVIKVLHVAQGQDLVFLLVMYFTGARRGEVFRLSWPDVDLVAGKIRLTDHKAGGGAERVRWLVMHPELVKALAWWRDARPRTVDNVFMQTHNDGVMGQPYRQRIHFMDTLCRRAGVKPFGFHAIRHKSAAITFTSKGLNAAQVLMGHYRATTTDIYVRSAGLYADQGVILDALGNSVIGKAVSGLLAEAMPLCGADMGQPVSHDKEMPQKAATSEAFCTPEHVHNVLQ